MEAIAIIGRLDGLTAESLVEDVVSTRIVDPYILGVEPGSSLPLSLTHRCLVTWLMLYVGAIVLYLSAASLDYFAIALLRRARGELDPVAGKTNMRSEITFSLWSLAIMSMLSVPLEVCLQLGMSKVYDRVEEYPLWYLAVSPVVFVLVSDCTIYWIHRILHHRTIYRYIHKPHHGYVHTTAFAAFAFHPLDGFLQGVAYQLFPFVFPFYSAMHLLSMGLVLLWTINIHDRMTLGIPGVNGAAHHTIHHTTFKSNYGQYLTMWDKAFGTFRDPNLWHKSGAPPMTEREVYGKDA